MKNKDIPGARDTMRLEPHFSLILSLLIAWLCWHLLLTTELKLIGGGGEWSVWWRDQKKTPMSCQDSLVAMVSVVVEGEDSGLHGGGETR